ncbi:hypothetical protein [aff. Roholtiella sp. LEGE 12411]|uniref:hypothetical protein n=1 Tax=aff. Roholtiella sp. LEGE 12411 TaxID=1828822 RepID=UPI0018800209|nr:hypothetical protein [aff. Roholtiella sp. LEGE 12411]MBE9036045.1 hypothetical protein [aff. Roholtiella sp. LEGE 12411]
MKTKRQNINLNSPSLIVDNTFTWKGQGQEFERIYPRIWDSKCRLRIYKSYSMPNIVICSDLDERDTGTSITNSVENLATLVWQKYSYKQLNPNSGYVGGQFIFIEHYPCDRNDEEETFALVQFNWDTERFQEPRWSPLTPAVVLALIN